jgi:uroporphyrin-III C-methyltransferase/precorrin-2 dehydrogenase/sirohydrochlorin ferrochelatase
MGYYPISLEMSNRPCLVIGGGAVAQRKAEALLAVGALVTVISPKLTEQLSSWVGKGKIHHVALEYEDGDLDGYEIVFVATDDNDVNKAVAKEGRSRRVWVNAADDPANCDFILPSVLRRGDLTVAVSTGGKSPALAKAIREDLEKSLPEHYSLLTRVAGEVRQELRERSLIPSADAWRNTLNDEFRQLIREGREHEASEYLRDRLIPTPLESGKVYLVGAGPGDPKLLTVRALELLRMAEVIVYDRLVNPVILEEVPPGAIRVFVGKDTGHHPIPQEEINSILINFARQGRHVIRLKGGDPFVFGRGGEEAEVLAEAGISFEIVPGVTSAVAVPAYAGIPLTYRKVSSSFAVITGHEALKSLPSVDWESLATAVDTLVVVMGLTNLPAIVTKLMAHGRMPETPIALIRWGTTEKQQTVTGTLADIVDKASLLKPPVLAVIGDVVKLRDKISWFDELAATLEGEGQFNGVQPQEQP